MKGPPRAQLAIAPLPGVPNGWRYSAECDASLSTLVLIPGKVDLPPGAMVLAVGYLHAERCGECCVDDVLNKGDQDLRKRVDRMELLMSVRERVN